MTRGQEDRLAFQILHPTSWPCSWAAVALIVLKLLLTGIESAKYSNTENLLLPSSALLDY